MSKINDGGYAFPIPADDKAGWHAESGMTLRDWFAGKALGGMSTWTPGHQFGLSDQEGIKARAEWAYQQADAMIAAREVKS